MKKPLIYIIGLVFLAATPGLQAQTAADHLRAGDRYFAQFDDAKALAEYEKAAKLDPTNYDAVWKTSQAYMNVGDGISQWEKDHEQKRVHYYDISEKYLWQALRLNPNDSRTHILNAAVLGRQARTASRKQQIALAYRIKIEIDRALELDPHNDLAWHGLAYWNRTLAEVSGALRFLGSIIFGRIPKGSFEEAVKGFQKAIALNPNYCDHHIELARTYLDLNKKDLAAREFQIAADCPTLTSMCPLFKEHARRELERLKASKDVSFDPGSEFLP